MFKVAYWENVSSLKHIHMRKNFIYKFLVQFLCMYETWLRNLFFLFYWKLFNETSFFVLYTYCILTLCMLIWKVTWGQGWDVRIFNTLVLTFFKETVYLGVGISVCSFWKQLTCFFLSSRFNRLAVLLSHVVRVW